MTKEQLLELLEKKSNEMRTILETGETEKRNLTADETANLENLRTQVRSLSTILGVPVEEKETEKRTKTTSMTLTRMIRESRGVKRGEAASAEFTAVNEAGLKELRAMGVDAEGDLFIPNLLEDRSVVTTPDNKGGAAIQTDKMSILSPLMNDLVLAKAGATMLTGLRGNVAIPSVSGISATWEGETAETANQDPSFGQVNMKPKRLSVVVNVSDTWLAQESTNADSVLRKLIADRIREKLESTCLGSDAGSATQPEGLFNGVKTTDATAASWAEVVKAESMVLERNAKPNAYIMHPILMSIFKTTPKSQASQAFVINDGSGTMNAIPYYATNGVVKGIGGVSKGYGLLCADMRDYFVGMWNNVSIKVDPYTLASANQTRLIINFYVDAVKVRDESFAAIVLKDGTGGFPDPASETKSRAAKKEF